MRASFQAAAQGNNQKDLGHAYRISEEAREFLDESGAEFATTKEYVDWLEDYFRNGGKVSSIYSGDMEIFDVHIVRQDANLPALYGAESLDIIVPAGVDVEFDDIGHNAVYEDGGSITGDDSVPLYKDSTEELRRRGYSFADIACLYTGPEWNREDDMETLEKFFSGPVPEPEQEISAALTRNLPVPRGPLGFKK